LIASKAVGYIVRVDFILSRASALHSVRMPSA
jgi:hypothetical protein